MFSGSRIKNLPQLPWKHGNDCVAQVARPCQRFAIISILALLFSLLPNRLTVAKLPTGLDTFLRESCVDCHDTNTETNLDLSSLDFKLEQPDNFRQWVHVFDRGTTA